MYSAVLKIPIGQTRSYAWVARAAGAPRASRAVGNALNKNPFAPWVPCHRVIAADGSSGGYQAGPGKKAGLLRREREYVVKRAAGLR